MSCPTLVVSNGAEPDLRILINQDQFTIGRGVNNCYIITSISVSRFHCLIEKVNDNWILFNKGSNGTLVNRVKVGEEGRKLQNGDALSFGDVEAKFEWCKSEKLNEGQILQLADDIIQAFEEELDVFPPSEDEIKEASPKQEIPEEKAAPAPMTAGPSNVEFAEDELQCNICTEMFIHAVTLNCSHTFCDYCITKWKQKQNLCPICRGKITMSCRTLVLDNYIAKILENAPEDLRNHRNEIMKEREDEGPRKRKLSEGGPSEVEPARVHEVLSVTISSSDDEMTSSWSSGDSDSDDYNGLSGAYFGGYGHCFTCGDRGHWANGCPNKRRRY